MNTSSLGSSHGSQKTVLIMAGGTGGHVFPALAVAEKLKSQGVHVEWLGTQKGIESTVVPQADIPISFITVTGLRGKGLRSLFMAPLLLVKALFQAMKVIRRVQPISVLGMGGFASGPGGLASWMMGKPLVIHEQNAVAGTTNRILSKFATVKLQAFPGAIKNALHIGNPIRSSIEGLPTPAERYNRSAGKLKVLVLGGSLGAAALNALVPAAMGRIDESIRPDVWHQVGKRHLDDAQNYYKQAKVDARVDAFIDDMGEAYCWADLVICRAGALTVSEVTTVGVAAVLVPYPFAIDDHQTKNAEWIVENQAGYLFQQTELTEEKLSELIERLAQDRENLEIMAKKSRDLSIANSAQQVAEKCLEVSNV